MNRFTAYDFRGQRMTLRQIAEATGIYPKTLLYRYNQSKSMDEAASRPVLGRGRRSARIYRERANV